MTILCIRSHPSHIEDAILASLTGDVQMTILCSHPSHTRSSHLQGKGKIFISQLFFFSDPEYWSGPRDLTCDLLLSNALNHFCKAK